MTAPAPASTALRSTSTGDRVRRLFLRVLLGLGAVALVAGPAAPGLPAARALDTGSLVVEDTAGVLYRPQLERDLAPVSFHQPTRVAIYTVRGTGSSETALNAAVLAFARERHPEWLSADGQRWADGLFVLALDPQDRRVGTYFGEDRDVPRGQQESIQNATKDLYRDGKWTDGTIAGVERAASLIERPWYLNPALWIAAGAGVVVVLVVVGILAWSRAKRRHRFEEALGTGNESYAAVTRDLEVTELHANTIPASSTHGSRILQRWSSFLTDYHDLTTVKSRLDGVSRRARGSSTAVADAEDYERRIVRLDGLDDAIADTNALLNHDSGWEEAWRRQSRDLLEQLDEAIAMIDTPETAGSEESRGAIRALDRQVRADVETWGAGLRDGTLTADAALDRLADAQRELGTRMDVHADAVIADRTSTEKEAGLMRTALENSRRGTGPQRRNSSIVRYSYPDLGTLPVWMYVAGFSAGQSSVDQARSVSSSGSGGSTAGYGSSGGSFSGSGSSSSF